jgi:hypothetical protein
MNVKTDLKAGFEASTTSIPAGPIWSDSDAANRCPGVCNAYGMDSNGAWRTTVPGQMSECDCVY